MLDVELDHQPKVCKQTKHLKFVNKPNHQSKPGSFKEAHQDVVCKMASVPPKPGETRSLSQLEAGVRRVGSFHRDRPKKGCSGNDGYYRMMQEPCRFGKGAIYFHEFAYRLLRVHLIFIPSTLHTSKAKSGSLQMILFHLILCAVGLAWLPGCRFGKWRFLQGVVSGPVQSAVKLRRHGQTLEELSMVQSRSKRWIKIGVPQNGCCIHNGKPYFLMDDLGVPLFSETSIFIDVLLVKMLVNGWC